MMRLVIAIVALLATGCEDGCKRTMGQCCKVCKSSKACGDSCIASGQSCSKSGGCACNGLLEDLGIE
ncbi:MAG: hypothetical protein ACTHU0_01330 [Kofleriaceae bacterium]